LAIDDVAAARAVTVLALVRQAFLGFVLLVAVFGAVVVAIEIGEPPSPDSGRWAAISMLAAVTILVVTPRFDSRLDCAGPPRALALSYQRRFFRRLANAVVAVGFIVGMTTATWWIYPVMALASVPAFLRAMPSGRRIAADEEKLRERGCRLDLLDTLLDKPTR